MRVTTTTRNLVYQRDNFRCIHCGAASGLMLRCRFRPYEFRGGVVNSVVMCVTDSNRIDNDQSFSDLAMNYGWKLRTWEQPENRDVYYPADGEWYTLTERGTRIKVGETADYGG